jgi:hypothetical protein
MVKIKNGWIVVNLILSLLLSGCSAISVKHHIVGNETPLCLKNTGKKKVAVYWGTAWRKNQKDMLIREKYIDDGLNAFFHSTNCFETISISKTIKGKNVLLVTDEELISAGVAIGADKVIKFRIEELGPNLYLYLSPILWETQNEVSLQVKILNMKTGKVESDISTQCKRGGAFTFNSAESLPDNFTETLKTIFFDDK